MGTSVDEKALALGFETKLKQHNIFHVTILMYPNWAVCLHSLCFFALQNEERI